MLAANYMEELTEEQSSMVEALLSARTAQEAASAIGISRAELYRRLQEPELGAALRRARGTLMVQALSRLHAEALEAVATLSEIMRDKQATAASRVRAAEAVINFALQGSEHLDLAEELAELRRAYEEIQQNKG